MASSASNIQSVKLSWDDLQRLLPEEYINTPELYDANITEASPLDESQKLKNLLLRERDKFFSDEGYAISDLQGALGRIWAHFHGDVDKKPDGLIITYAKKDYFCAWKGLKITQDKKIQSVIWIGKRVFTSSKSRGSSKAFPKMLKDALLSTPAAKPEKFEWTAINLTSDQIRAIKELCGNSRPYLPPSLKEQVFPSRQSDSRSSSGSTPDGLLIAIVVVAAAGYLFKDYILNTPQCVRSIYNRVSKEYF